MFKNKFNLNGIDYKVVDGLVHTLSKGTLDPCYRGNNRALDEFCRTHDLALYVRPKGQHAYGHQTGQRAKTLKEQKQHAPPLTAKKDQEFTFTEAWLDEKPTKLKITKDKLFQAWVIIFLVSSVIIGICACVLLYELVLCIG